MEEQRKFDIIRYIHTVKCLKHIFVIFDQKREKFIREAKVQFAVNMFAIKFRIWQQKKKKTYDERNMQIAR